MPFIFKFNSHQQPSLSNIDVTIRVHYNCQMWESLAISAIPTNKTYLRLEARIKNTTLTNHGPARCKTIYTSQMQNERLRGQVHVTIITSTYRKLNVHHISLFYSNAPRRSLHVLFRRQSYCSCSMSTHTLMISAIITCNYSVNATGTKKP